MLENSNRWQTTDSCHFLPVTFLWHIYYGLIILANYWKRMMYELSHKRRWTSNLESTSDNPLCCKLWPNFARLWNSYDSGLAAIQPGLGQIQRLLEKLAVSRSGSWAVDITGFSAEHTAQTQLYNVTGKLLFVLHQTKSAVRRCCCLPFQGCSCILQLYQLQLWSI